MWILFVGTFFYLDIQYLNDPGWDLNDEHKGIFILMILLWVLVICKKAM